MSDFKGEEGQPRIDGLDRLRRDAIRCFVGGVALIALRLIARLPVLSYAAGGLIVALGIGWMLANNPVNKRTGIFIIVLGILQAFSRFPVPHIALVAGTALGVANMWLIVTGARYLISYMMGQGKRYK
ncbi:MAG: hypothetical protein FWE09_08405 [Treponema sp.]|nr:hypothetical protein [Treponema sp.]